MCCSESVYNMPAMTLSVALPVSSINPGRFRLVVPRDAAGGTPTDYGNQVLDNTIAVLGRITTIDDLVAEWATTD